MTIQIAHTCRPRTAVVCAPFTDYLVERRSRGSRRAHASRTAGFHHHRTRLKPASDRESGLESP